MFPLTMCWIVKFWPHCPNCPHSLCNAVATYPLLFPGNVSYPQPPEIPFIIKKCPSPAQTSEDLPAWARDVTRLIWNGKSVSGSLGKRLLTHHRSIYTGLSFSHNPPGSTCLGLEGCCSVEGVLNSTNRGLRHAVAPFQNEVALLFLVVSCDILSWCVAMWLYISTVRVLCSAAVLLGITLLTISIPGTWCIPGSFHYIIQVDNITWNLFLYNQWSVAAYEILIEQ